MQEKHYITYIRRLNAIETRRLTLKLGRAYKRLRILLVMWLRKKGLKRIEDAEDVSQKVWTELYNDVKFRKIKTWSDAIVFHVAYHRFLDHVSRERNRNRLRKRYKPEGSIRDLFREIRIEQCKAGLPSVEREVIDHLYEHGRIVEECAERLRISTSTVKRIQRRALMRIRSRHSAHG